MQRTYRERSRKALRVNIWAGAYTNCARWQRIRRSFGVARSRQRQVSDEREILLHGENWLAGPEQLLQIALFALRAWHAEAASSIRRCGKNGGATFLAGYSHAHVAERSGTPGRGCATSCRDTIPPLPAPRSLAIFLVLNHPNPGIWTAKLLPEQALFLLRDIECNRNLITGRRTSKGLHAFDSFDHGKASERNACLHALSHATASDLPDHAKLGFFSDLNRVSNCTLLRGRWA